MRRFARLFLVSVLALDLIIAVSLLGGGGSLSLAQAPRDDEIVPLEGSQIPESTRWTREALQLLGREMATRASDLDKRQLEVEEMLRSAEVLNRAGIGDGGVEGKGDGGDNKTGADPAAAQAQPAVVVPQTGARPGMDAAARQELFTRLRKTYENMEPESAAIALSQLAMLDKGAVVELILGWKPRAAAAVLDALTQSDPALAADLSYGIWLRSGKNQPGGGTP